MGRFYSIYMILICSLCLAALPVGAQGKTAHEASADYEGLIDVKECAGVEVTQCELAKNLILTLKMGEDLTCEACFIQLQALGIAPGEDWSYADPHTVVTLEEMKEVVVEVHDAFNRGTVRLDGFEVAADINGFCRGIKGPSATPVPSEQEEKATETETEAPSVSPSTKPQEHDAPPADTTLPPTEQEEKETPSTDPLMKPDDQDPAPTSPSAPPEENDQHNVPPPADTQESDTQKVVSK